MSDINKKPGVGHNSSTEYVGGVEFLHSALEDAIHLVHFDAILDVEAVRPCISKVWHFIWPDAFRFGISV